MEPPGVVHTSDLRTSLGSESGVLLTTAAVVEPLHSNEGDELNIQVRQFWPISEIVDIKIEDEYEDLQPVEENPQKTSALVRDDYNPLISAHDSLLPTKSELEEDTLDYPCEKAIVVHENALYTQTEHHDFCIGDIVWVESETDSWWPGRICDPARDAFSTPQSPGMSLFLVRFIDEWRFFWRRPSQIMHFSDGYNQFLRKSRSRRFHFAVNKAVEEIGKWAVQSVSCPCMCRESSSENNGEIFERRECSVVPFEPEDFLCRLELASYSSVVVNELEIMVIRSYLGVFYTFLGHCHLPLFRLDDSVVAEEETSFHGSTMAAGNHRESQRIIEDIGIHRDDIRSPVKGKTGYEGRERRRSKYLSPPYVDVSFRRKCASENCIPTVMRGDGFSPDGEDDNLSVVIGLAAGGGGPVKKRKLHRLCVSSPSEMMDVLRLMAAGCFFSAENGFLSSTSDLFFRFRNSVFRGGSDYGSHSETGMVEKSGTDAGLLGQSYVSSGQQIGLENVSKRMKKKSIWKTEENSVSCWQSRGMSDDVMLANTEGGNNENFRLEWKPSLEENISDSGGKWNPDATALVVREVQSDPKSEDQFHESPGSIVNSIVDRGSWPIHEYSSKDGPHLKKGACANPDPSPPHKNRGRSKPKNRMSSTTIIVPDLNRSTDALIPLSVPETGVSYSPKKKKPRMEKDPLPHSGNTLLLTFEEGCPPPSKDSLLRAFYSFGEIVESETEQTTNGPAETGVVFVRSCDAGEAFRSLEKVNPFGPSLVKYRLLHQSGATRPAMEAAVDADGITSAIPLLVRPAYATSVKTVCSGAPIITEVPSLPLVRRNLEVMREVLERSGDELSPETKAKLQEEIKGLLRKVSTITGSPF